ncbi:RNA-binding protein RO60-like isoform X2 [Lycorma delicatula]|uniref:RNA-binding protein RO60-like isoform X2 n=1 Tax=Lycorma delicatula TaxID=130591 RepID=UPI003F5155A7
MKEFQNVLQRTILELPNAVNEMKVARNIAAPAEIRLKRFLHYGNEEAVYIPGHKQLKVEKLKSIEALVHKGKAADAVNIILKAHAGGYFAQREAVIFALAVCAKQKLSVPLKEAAYSAVKKICITSQDLFLFIKYLHDLGDKTNTGHGWKRAINDWYLSKETMELAEIVTKHRSHFQYTHKDIFKLSHIKTEDIGKRTVIMYVMRGLQEAVKQFSNEKDAQAVLTYLQAVEDFKHTTDVNVAARLIDSHTLTLEYVNTHEGLLKTREIWLSLIPTMTPNKLLDCLQTLSIRGLLKGNTPLVRRYYDALNNPTAVVESGIQPARVFIELRTYELSAKEKVALAVKLNREWATKKSAAAPKTNPIIVDAIHKLFKSSFKMLVPTGLRYLVAMDGRDKLWVNRCWHSRYVTLGEAAVLVALNLISAERDVVFGSFVAPQSHFSPISIAKESSIMELTSKVKARGVSVVPPLVHSVFSWAEANKKLIDVFIILGDNTLQVDRVGSELMRYRRTMQLPNTKIITCSLNGPCKRSREVQGNGQLCIFGFDEHTPRVIEGFSRGAF